LTKKEEDMLRNASVAHVGAVAAAVVGIEEEACFDLLGCHD
jgi:hypothetical protein